MSIPPTYRTRIFPRTKDAASARWVIMIAVVFAIGFLLYKVAVPSKLRESRRSDAGAVLNAQSQAKDSR